MVTKELIFDMDGTIADLYGVEGWLEKLRSEDPSPYADARPMYDMDTLIEILKIYKGIGYDIAVVSWGSKTATPAYDAAVRKTKIEWLQHFGFPCDRVHVVKYGTPKQKFIKADVSILIDDDEKVRASFMEDHNDDSRKVIDATKNIIEQLINMLVA